LEEQVTSLLQAWAGGDASALERLTPIIYSELHRLARVQMAGERSGHILQPSALVNEAFVRLMGDASVVPWANRAHFYGVSARLMRQILVDFARAEETRKRGARAAHVNVSDLASLAQPQPSIAPADLIAVDDALKRLAELDARQAKVVELRFFGGLQNHEIAQVLGISEPTVVRDWRLARAWLFSSLSG
jgi:RNA polymerase sigma-70 factor, ECF subfamily